MAERIDLPAMPKGEPEEQLEELYRYLYRMAEALNANLAEIGGADLTDEERKLMLSLTQADGTTRSGGGAAYDWESAETLKSLIIKTATWVKNTLDSWRISLLGEYVAQGKFGKYVRNTSMDVDVTPTGTTQNFKFHEIIEDLKKYEVNAKNYIKTGYLRTESGLPVYGVAVGKDIVTFAEDGTETYNDGNKVGEFTADGISFFRKNNGSLVKLAELLGTALKFYYGGSLRTQMDSDGVKFYNGSTLLAQLKSGELDFYQGGNLAMKLTSTRLGFYNSGTEYMYLSGGKMYVNGNFELNATNFLIDGSEGYMAIPRTITTAGLTFKALFEYGKNKVTPDANPGSTSFVYALTDSPESSAGSFKKYPGARMMVKDALYRVGGAIDLCATMDVWTAYAAQPTTAFGLYPFDLGMSFGNGALGSDSWRWTFAWIEYINARKITAQTVTQTSSREVKHDIQDLPKMGAEIDQLRPVSFIYNDDETGKTQYGLIHEETVGIMPDICSGAEGDDPKAKGINYISLVPVLLKEIQDLRKRTAMLEKRVEELEGRE